jgi:hypothetical protein
LADRHRKGGRSELPIRDTRKIEWLDVSEIDPDCTLFELAKWIQVALTKATPTLKKRKEWREIETEASLATIEMSRIEGVYFGGSQALIPWCDHSGPIYAVAAKRITELNLGYEIARKEWVEHVCKLTIQTTGLSKQLPQGGRPMKGIPDYDAPGFQTWEACEFDIAVKAMRKREKTGRYQGIKQLVDKAMLDGKLPENYDIQRVNRLAKSLNENSPLYLPPTLKLLRARASERVKMAEDFLTSFIG